MVLVRNDVAGPLLDRTLVAHPNLIRHLLQQPEVVRNEDHAALELLDAVGQCINAFQIQVLQSEVGTMVKRTVYNRNSLKLATPVDGCLSMKPKK